MTRRKLPPNLRARKFTTADGRSRTLYYVRLRWHGTDYEIPAGDELAVAIQKRDLVLGKLTLGYDLATDPDNLRGRKIAKKPGLTFDYWADLWLKVTSHKRSHAKDELSAGRLKEFFGTTPITQISIDQIEDYKRLRSDQPTSRGSLPAPATINRELAALRSIFSLAIKERALSYRPVVTLYPEHNTRTRTATPEELELILATVSGWVRSVLIILAESGMRLSEVCTLKRPQIDLTEQLIRLTHTKSSRPRLIPMSPTMFAVFQSALAPCDASGLVDHVFLTDKGQPVTRHKVRHQWDQACKKLGIEGLTRHDLRATFLTTKLAEGWDRDLLKPIAGISADATFSRYNRLSIEHLRRVMTEPGPKKARPIGTTSGHK